MLDDVLGKNADQVLSYLKKVTIEELWIRVRIGNYMCNNRTIIPTFSPSFCQIPVGGGGDLPPPPTYNSEPTIISLHEYQCIIIHAKKILIERKDILALKSTAWKKKTISCMSEDYLYKSCMKKYLEIT